MVSRINLGPFPNLPGYAEARSRDASDPLAPFSKRFAPTEPDLVYLDGNSLGRLPLAAARHLEELVTNEWGRNLIRSWPDRWWTLADSIGSQLAPLVGAAPNEVIIADSTSVVLFKLAVAALRARPERTRIITDDLNFPTDGYILEAAAAAVGNPEIVTVGSDDAIHGPTDALIAAMGHDTALVSLSHVAFKSGFLYDMSKLTSAAHAVGALVLWDLSHSVGALPIELDACNADLAVGCTYKYLNGGPGSPAFAYVNNTIAGQLNNPIPGWWGHEDPFAFDLEYRPTTSIRRFQTGTMPILSLAPIEHGAALTLEAGVDRLRTKSVAQSEFLIELTTQLLAPHGFELASPADAAQRGSHVSLRHAEGWRIAQALIDLGKVIPDFRDPDNIRLGLAPLYTSFIDIHNAVGRIIAIIESGQHELYPEGRGSVT